MTRKAYIAGIGLTAFAKPRNQIDYPEYDYFPGRLFRVSCVLTEAVTSAQTRRRGGYKGLARCRN
jgi:hypothetical protein